MSSVNIPNSDEEVELGIDNNAHTPETTTTGKRKTPLIDTTGLENANAILDTIASLHKIADVNKKNEQRKLREMTYNSASLDLSKKKKFMKYLDEVPASIMKEVTGKDGKTIMTQRKITKPEIIKYIFQQNDIKSAKEGFTLTTMAMAWLEYFGLKDSITLEKMKKRIHTMIFSATDKLGASIYGTPITKFKYLYYITTDPEDHNKQSKAMKETAELFDKVSGRRKSLGEQLKKEIEEKKEKAKQKLIEVDTTGQQSQTSNSLVEPEPTEPNENANEGEESEIE
jgi:hypothetical protein